MRIVADQNIPQVEGAFSALGRVEVLRSSEITSERVRDADLLLVRSTVKVGEALLSGSRVRFVATATIGTDHLDLAWLRRQGIAVSSAPGSNAQSVAEWWLAALLDELERQQIASLAGLRLGVVGVGQVGGRVAALGEALGMQVSRCDPPRARREADFVSEPLDDLVPGVDVLTLHTPLHDEGLDATRGLMSAARLARLRAGAILINAARGELVDGAALLAALQQNSLYGLCDVFPGEPAPEPELIAACQLATPHIAGHSLDGKVNGTVAIYRAACAHLGVAPSWSPRLPEAQPRAISLATDAISDEAILQTLLRLRYDQAADDAALRAIARLSSDDRAAGWRRFRDGYRVRRELLGLVVRLPAPALAARPRLAAALALLGCVVEGEPVGVGAAAAGENR